MIVTLSGIGCNGKTTLLKALKYELEREGRKVFIFPEKVRLILNHIQDFKQRQTTIFFTYLNHLKDLIEIQEKSCKKSIFISDRSVLDVIAFTYLKDKDLAREFSDIMISELEDYMSSKTVIDILSVFIKAPKNVEVIRECFEDKHRADTLSYTDFIENAKEFFEYFEAVHYDLFSKGWFSEFEVDNSLLVIKSPIDNPYVIYDILQKIKDMESYYEE